MNLLWKYVCYRLSKAPLLTSCVTGYVIAGLLKLIGTNPTPDPNHIWIQDRASGEAGGETFWRHVELLLVSG